MLAQMSKRRQASINDSRTSSIARELCPIMNNYLADYMYEAVGAKYRVTGAM